MIPFKKTAVGINPGSVQVTSGVGEMAQGVARGLQDFGSKAIQIAQQLKQQDMSLESFQAQSAIVNAREAGQVEFEALMLSPPRGADGLADYSAAEEFAKNNEQRILDALPKDLMPEVRRSAELSVRTSAVPLFEQRRAMIRSEKFDDGRIALEQRMLSRSATGAVSPQAILVEEFGSISSLMRSAATPKGRNQVAHVVVSSTAQALESKLLSAQSVMETAKGGLAGKEMLTAMQSLEDTRRALVEINGEQGYAGVLTGVINDYTKKMGALGSQLGAYVKAAEARNLSFVKQGLSVATAAVQSGRLDHKDPMQMTVALGAAATPEEQKKLFENNLDVWGVTDPAQRSLMLEDMQTNAKKLKTNWETTAGGKTSAVIMLRRPELDALFDTYMQEQQSGMAGARDRFASGVKKVAMSAKDGLGWHYDLDFSDESVVSGLLIERSKDLSGDDRVQFGIKNPQLISDLVTPGSEGQTESRQLIASAMRVSVTNNLPVQPKQIADVTAIMSSDRDLRFKTDTWRSRLADLGMGKRSDEAISAVVAGMVDWSDAADADSRAKQITTAVNVLLQESKTMGTAPGYEDVLLTNNAFTAEAVSKISDSLMNPSSQSTNWQNFLAWGADVDESVQNMFSSVRKSERELTSGGFIFAQDATPVLVNWTPGSEFGNLLFSDLPPSSADALRKMGDQLNKPGDVMTRKVSALHALGISERELEGMTDAERATAIIGGSLRSKTKVGDIEKPNGQWAQKGTGYVFQTLTVVKSSDGSEKPHYVDLLTEEGTPALFVSDQRWEAAKRSAVFATLGAEGNTRALAWALDNLAHSQRQLVAGSKVEVLSELDQLIADVRKVKQNVAERDAGATKTVNMGTAGYGSIKLESTVAKFPTLESTGIDTLGDRLKQAFHVFPQNEYGKYMFKATRYGKDRAVENKYLELYDEVANLQTDRRYGRDLPNTQFIPGVQERTAAKTGGIANLADPQEMARLEKAAREYPGR